MAESRWGDIFNHLKGFGFDVKSPGTEIGVCKQPYIIVKYDGSSAHTSFSTDVDLYAVQVYVPASQYSKVEAIVQEVKQAMKELEPLILPYGQQTASFYDDEVKANMVSIEYKNYKKQ